MFTLKGTLEGKPAELTWDDGEVTGTERAVALYRVMQKENGQKVEVPGYAILDNKNSSDPLACYMIMKTLLFLVTEWEGEIPSIPKIPKGAIG